MSGKVWLVGAGPGDPELLTIKAARAIASADVILVDDLVNRAILVHAREDVRVIHVGKRGGCKSTPQAFIEKLMVSEARAGRVVVRLKGGDPFIVGRGGEEIEALTHAGVECGVINGITAGLAAATSAGVPLTHRAITQGAIFVTAHGKGPDEPDWSALVKTGMTLVVYMGVARVQAIEASLLRAGMSADIPVLVVEKATLPAERQLRTTLGTLARSVASQDIASPAVMVIGEVAREHAAAAPLALKAS